MLRRPSWAAENNALPAREARPTVPIKPALQHRQQARKRPDRHLALHLAQDRHALGWVAGGTVVQLAVRSRAVMRRTQVVVSRLEFTVQDRLLAL